MCPSWQNSCFNSTKKRSCSIWKELLWVLLRKINALHSLSVILSSYSLFNCTWFTKISFTVHKFFSFPLENSFAHLYFQLILTYKSQLGNPVLEYSTDFNSRAEFFWSHGLISDTTYKMFTSVCNYSRYVSEYYRGSVSPRCSRVMSQVTRETSRFVDKYDVTLDVCISSVLSQSKVLTPKVSIHYLSNCKKCFEFGFSLV